MKLYFAPQSRAVRVAWLLEELELNYEIEKYSVGDRALRTPEYYKIHPMGRVPVLEDGDIRIYESGAIVQYLLEKYGRGRFVPSKDDPNFAEYLQWVHYAEGSIMPVLDIHRATALHALAVLQEQQERQHVSQQSFLQDDDEPFHQLNQATLKSIRKGRDFFRSRKLSLSRFGFEKTYEYHLEGSLESISHSIMVDLERRQKQRSCTGTGFTFIRPGVFPLPRYRFKATLESPYPTSSGGPDDSSRLQICWFGDKLQQPIDEMVFAALGGVNWEATATNYDRYYV